VINVPGWVAIFLVLAAVAVFVAVMSSGLRALVRA
jgi:hypothetical protein